MTYETKTVRIHHPDEGRYVYLMLTRFDGEGHLLADEGWGGTYTHYAVISRNPEWCVSDLNAFEFVRSHDHLQDTPTERFVKDYDIGRIDWHDFEDEEMLTPEDIAALTDVDDVQETEADAR